MNSKQISLLAAFLAANVEYVVVGGVAVNVHGYLRATTTLTSSSGLQKRTPRAAFKTLEGLGVPLEGLEPTDLLDDEANFRFGPDEDHTAIAWKPKWRELLCPSSPRQT